MDLAERALAVTVNNSAIEIATASSSAVASEPAPSFTTERTGIPSHSSTSVVSEGSHSSATSTHFSSSSSVQVVSTSVSSSSPGSTVQSSSAITSSTAMSSSIIKASSESIVKSSSASTSKSSSGTRTTNATGKPTSAIQSTSKAPQDFGFTKNIAFASKSTSSSSISKSTQAVKSDVVNSSHASIPSSDEVKTSTSQPQTTSTSKSSSSSSVSTSKSSSSTTSTHDSSTISRSTGSSSSSASTVSPFKHNAGPLSTSQSSSSISTSHSSSKPASLNGQVRPTDSSAQKTSSDTSLSSLFSTPSTSLRVSSTSGTIPTNIAAGQSAPDASAQGASSFFQHKALVGGVFAVGAVLITVLVIGGILLCRRRHAKQKNSSRHRRGISWPASAPDSDGLHDHIIGTPRPAPSPPMTQAHSDYMLSRDTFGTPYVPDIFRDPQVPAPIAMPSVMGMRSDTPTSGNFGYPFRTMYPDQPSVIGEGVGIAVTTGQSIRVPSVHSSVHRASPSMRESSPSMYAESLPESDVDSLYTRETAGGRPVNPFTDARAVEPATPIMSNAPSAFVIARKPAPPVPPRHYRRPSVDTSSNGHCSNEHAVQETTQGLGLIVDGLSNPPSKADFSPASMRGTFLNIRPKRNSVGTNASASGSNI